MSILFVVDSNFYRHLSPARVNTFPKGSRLVQCTSYVTLLETLSNTTEFRSFKYWFVSGLSNVLARLKSPAEALLREEVLKIKFKETLQYWYIS